MPVEWRLSMHGFDLPELIGPENEQYVKFSLTFANIFTQTIDAFAHEESDVMIRR
jgi:hypothetical protein